MKKRLFLLLVLTMLCGAAAAEDTGYWHDKWLPDYEYTGGKRPGRLHAAPGESLTCGDYEIDKDVRYIRVSIQDAQGRWADTHGFFRDEIGFAPLEK